MNFRYDPNMKLPIIAKRKIVIILLISMLMLLLTAGKDRPMAAKTICEVQGRESESSYVGRMLRVAGVVTYDLDEQSEKGFFMQLENCDNDPWTSDAIFVYLGEKKNVVSTGDVAVVDGRIVEFFGLTEISIQYEGELKVLDKGPMPAPVPFSPPWEEDLSLLYKEAHEGMLVRVPAANVVGPATARGDVFVVDSAWSVNRVYEQMDSGAIVQISAQGLYKIEVDVVVSDQLQGLSGILDYQRGDYKVHLLSEVGNVMQSEPVPEKYFSTSDFSFATLNLHNLFDTENDPDTNDSVPSGALYRAKLEKLARWIVTDMELPLFISVQEAENGDVLQALVNRDEFPVQYEYILIDGPDQRGIDVGLLYRSDRVEILSSEARQGCTSLVDGLGPDGNLKVFLPSNELTCSTGNSNELDGNRLFSRPPLVMQLAVCQEACTESGERDVFWVVAFHLKSKSQDTDDIAVTEPRRIAQAAFLADIYREIKASEPLAKVILAGDFNDFPYSAAAEELHQVGLVNMMNSFPGKPQYTFIYKGVSQVLDQIFVSPKIVDTPGELLIARVLHIGADYPAVFEADASRKQRASDHDPVLVRKIRMAQQTFFPLITLGHHFP